MIKLPTGAQIRAARAWLGWDLGELSERAGIHRQTVYRAEQDGSAHVSKVSADTIIAICNALTAAGIEFGDDTLKLNKSK